MRTEVKMPRLSLTMESGVVLQWLKQAGDYVTKGEDLAELETDKVNVVMESPASGFVRTLLVEEGIAVPCDTIVAILTATADEGLEAPTQPPDPAPQAVTSPSSPVAPSPITGGRAHLNASPAAKNLARNVQVDLATVVGSGPGGRIGLEDVQRAADALSALQSGTRREAEPAVPAGERRVPLSKMRATVAQRMVLSTTTVPQFSVRRKVDMSGVLRLRTASVPPNATLAQLPSVIDILHFAVTKALQTHLEVNASFQADPASGDSYLILHETVNLGVAVALPDGLVVPVIHDAQSMSLAALTKARIEAQDAAKAGRLSVGSLTGATFTVSNLGPMKVDEFTALVNPPEAAILAVGRVQQDLLVRDGAIYTLPMVTLTITADHRVLDGAQVARFLDTLTNYLERPEEVLDHAG